ncbi:MAG: helix-turn-helix domain-containing protein [Acidimicrobiales bacterium]
MTADPLTREFLAALRPVAGALGAELVRRPTSGDIPVRWRGEVVAGLRPPVLTEALDRMIDLVERELGGPLATLDRTGKQQAIAILHERGAFTLRRSVDDVAEAMGVSRITIYNYLNALEAS